MTPEQKKAHKIRHWTTNGIIVSWVTFWLFLLWPIGVIMWVGILIFLIWNGAPLKSYFLRSAWVVVPAFCFIVGSISYLAGAGTLLSIGGPSTFHGIDRETRATSKSSGCIPIGIELFIFPANNAAVRLFTNLFGFQRGSYKGTFPTTEEANEIIRSGEVIKVKRTGNYLQFNTASTTVKLDTISFCKLDYAPLSFEKVIGKAINDECFVFQPIEKGDDDGKVIYLVDIGKNELISFCRSSD